MMAHSLLRALAVGGLALFALAFAGCSSDDGGVTDTGPALEDLRVKYGLTPYTYDDIPYPTGNHRDDPGYADRVELGRLLFFDHELAGRRDASCGTCHHPALAWGDARDLGAGVSGVGLGPERELTDSRIILMPRNVPTNLNAGLSSAISGGPPSERGMLFWDGRESGLEVQALQPPATVDEMSYHLASYGEPTFADSVAADSVASRLQQIAEYVDRFEDAFPGEGTGASALMPGKIERALAAYQRELVTLSGPYDRYLGGDDRALTVQEHRGMDLFFGRAECGSCHNGPMLSDYSMARIGVKHHGPGRDPILRQGRGEDLGLAEHTSRGEDLYKYRVPSLRNTELTGPWFRNGMGKNLREVIVLKSAAGVRPEDPARAAIFDRLYDQRIPAEYLDARMHPLDLSDEDIDDLFAFLKTLTDKTIDSPFIDPSVPLNVPSGLPTVERLEPFSLVPLAEHLPQP